MREIQHDLENPSHTHPAGDEEFEGGTVRTLLDKITDRAEAARNIRSMTVESWTDCWFETAASWRKELEAEGLTATVESLDGIVASMKRICYR